MVSGAWVGENGTVTGTFHYVTGYTGFNETVSAEQEGYFFPFTLTKTGTTMSFLKNGTPGKTGIPWEANNVFRVTPGDIFEIKVDGQKVVELNFNQATFEQKAGKATK